MNGLREPAAAIYLQILAEAASGSFGLAPEAVTVLQDWVLDVRLWVYGREASGLKFRGLGVWRCDGRPADWLEQLRSRVVALV